MKSVQLLAQAIDSFVFLYFATTPDLYNQVVEALFKTDEKKYTTYELEIFGRKWKVQQKIGRSWPIFMKSDDNIEIKLRITHPKEKAGMEIQIPKSILWPGDSFPAIEDLTQQIAKTFGPGDFSPSRLDLCRHYQMPRGLVLTEQDRALFTGHWRNFHTYYQSQGTRADGITGMRFGSFKSLTCYFKIYLKLEEIETNNSFDVTAYYSDAFDPKLDVVSFEMTVESQFMKGRRILSIPDLKGSLSGLWEYATHDYITQRDANSKNKEFRKRGMSEVWEIVSSPWTNDDFESLPKKEKTKVSRLSSTIKKKKKLQKMYTDIYGEDTNQDFEKLTNDPDLKKRGEK